MEQIFLFFYLLIEILLNYFLKRIAIFKTETFEKPLGRRPTCLIKDRHTCLIGDTLEIHACLIRVLTFANINRHKVYKNKYI